MYNTPSAHFGDQMMMMYMAESFHGYKSKPFWYLFQ